MHTCIDECRHVFGVDERVKFKNLQQNQIQTKWGKNVKGKKMKNENSNEKSIPIMIEASIHRVVRYQQRRKPL